MTGQGRGQVTIDRLRVAGFGHFQGLEAHPSPGLHLFYGANEAGKSTLLGFIRAVLFGFDRRAASRYEPDQGPHGGELVLQTPRGRFHVRRSAGKKKDGEVAVRGPSGERLADDALGWALGGISRELFCEVFAFSLEELSSFERLAKQSNVSEALLAAGMRGARRLPAALDQLRRATGDLFAPNATRGKRDLNRVLGDLADVQERLRRAGDRPAQYFAAARALEEARGALEHAGTQRSRWEELRGTLRRRLDAQLLLREWEVLAREAEEGAALATFPIGGIARLEAVLKRIEHVRGEAATVAAEREALAVALRSDAEALDLSRLREGLAAAERFAAVRSQLRQLPVRQAQQAERLSGLRRDWAELELEGPLEALATRSFPPAQRAQLASAGQRVVASTRRVEAAGEALDAARADLGKLDDALAGLETRVDEEGPSLETIEGALDACRQIPSAADACTAAAASLREAQAYLGAFRTVGSPVLAGPRVSLVLRVVALLSALAAVPAPWLWQTGTARGLWIAGSLAVAAALWLWGRQRAQAEADQTARLHAEARAREAERARFQDLESEASRREEAARQRLEQHCLRAGLSPATAAVASADRERTLRRLHQHAQDSLVHAQRVLTAREARLRSRERCAQVEAAWTEAERAREADDAGWRALLRTAELPERLAPPEAAELWGRLADLRQRLRDVASDGDALQREAEEVRRVGEALVQACGAVGWELSDPEAALARVGAAADAARAEQERRRRLAERETLLAAQATRWQRDLTDAETACRTLLAAGGCEDAETFRRRADAAEGYTRARRKMSELAGQVEVLTGMGCERLRRQIDEGGGEEGLARALEEAERAAAQAGEEVVQHSATQGGLESQLRAWAADSELRELRGQEEALRARVEELVERYAVDQLALLLLERAKDTHRLEQQPRLLQRASAHFWQLSRGRYVRVWAAPESPDGLRVLDSKQREWPAEVLSRGTREQLYLAFRLAVVEDLCHEKPALPLVLDDVLVNFDPDRADAAVALLARLSERHQILALTCHPWIRALFVSHGAQVTDLRDGSVVEAPAREEDGERDVVA